MVVLVVMVWCGDGYGGRFGHGTGCDGSGRDSCFGGCGHCDSDGGVATVVVMAIVAVVVLGTVVVVMVVL